MNLDIDTILFTLTLANYGFTAWVYRDLRRRNGSGNDRMDQMERRLGPDKTPRG
jgi:hypothetical protein